MPNGDDTQDLCCAIDLCCGGDDESAKRDAVAKLIKHQIGKPGPYTSQEAAAAVVDLFDLLPKHSIAALVGRLGKLARRFPYIG